MDVVGWIEAAAAVGGIIVVALTAAQLRVAILARRDTAHGQLVSSNLQDLTLADSIANEVIARWKDEIKARSLEPSDLINVRWRGDTEMKGHQVDLGGSVSGIVNQVTGMVDRFLALRSQRLILVGPPGSGKTALAIVMMLDLLSRRPPGGPVPIMLSLSSWDPHRPMRLWMKRRIVSEYMPKTDDDQLLSDSVDRLIQHDLIIPILDGLDELTEPMRKMALESINKVIPTQALILTCRREEYRNIVMQAGPLTSASVSTALPVAPEAVSSYLMKPRGARDPRTWSPIVDSIFQGSNLAVIGSLSNPFLLSLLTVTYGDPDKNPTEILDKTRFPTPSSIENHLLEGLLEVYRKRMLLSLDGRSWDPDKATRWLTNLARHLSRSSLYDIQLWQLPKAISRTSRIIIATVSALAGAVIAGLARSLVVGMVGGLFAGLLAGALISLIPHGRGGPKTRLPITTGKSGSTFLRGNGPLHTVIFSGASGLGAALLVHYFTHFSDADTGFYIGCVVAFLIGFAVGIPGWQGETLISESDNTKDPRLQLAEERRRNLLFAILVVCALVVAVSLLGWLRGGAVIGFLLGCFASFVIDRLSMGWWSYTLARVILAMNRTFPLRLTTFLEDSYNYGVLRRAGGVYQFRHAELQDHLAGVKATTATRHNPLTSPTA
jgi:hypothetical protein